MPDLTPDQPHRSVPQHDKGQIQMTASPSDTDPAPKLRFSRAGTIDTPSYRLRRYVGRRAGQGWRIAADTELLLVSLDGAGRLSQAGHHVDLPERAVALIPAGDSRLDVVTPGTFLALAPSLALSQGRTPPCRRRDPGSGPVVHRIDTLPTLPDNPRLRLVQGEWLSINWAEYEGPRDRTRLSPHAHRAFSQGAYVLAGTFVHHLRWPWGSDATQWRADRHQRVGPGDFIEIPAQVIHTTEGTGPGHHHMIELFCPPRADFRARGWIANASDYDAADTENA